jgi:hypothetical protein
MIDSSGTESPKSESKGESSKRKWLKGMWGKGELATEATTEPRTPSQTQHRHKVDRLSQSMTLDTPY